MATAPRMAEDVGTEFLLNIGFGSVYGYERVSALGHNEKIDTTTTPEDVWSGGGVYPWMVAPVSLELVSDSLLDGPTGTGARTVQVQGLNDVYVRVAVTVALNGTAPVPLPFKLLRCNGLVVATAGAGQVNAGAISLRDVTGGVVRGRMPAGVGTSRQASYTVPAGYMLSIRGIMLCINNPTSTRDATVATYIGAPNNGRYIMPLVITVADTPYLHDMVVGIVLPEKTDFGLRCLHVSTSGTDLTAAWIAILKRNDVV